MNEKKTDITKKSSFFILSKILYSLQKKCIFFWKSLYIGERELCPVLYENSVLFNDTIYKSISHEMVGTP